MKRLNNKGFAVSVILYSVVAVILLILLMTVSINATNIHNKSNQVDGIKEKISKLELVD